MGNAHKSRQACFVAAGIVALVFTVYWRVLGHGFAQLDDNVYITDNPFIRDGLSPGAVAWAFTTFHAANWHPLTWISHMIDFQLFGTNPLGHHLTSVVLHAVNGLLLFAVLNGLTGRRWPSAFVAALFVAHPLNVESVAWVAERKNVLSTFFWFLAMLAYIRYAAKPAPLRYSLVAGAFVLGLMSKPMLVTLPVVLLLLDFWPLGRLQATDHGLQVRKVLLEKAPLFGLALASCVVTVIAQSRGGAVNSFDHAPLAMRLDNALVSYVAYIGKTLWPSGLAVIYPHPLDRIPEWQIVGAAAALMAVTIAALRTARTKPYLTVGWLWYLITLVPVIGLAQVGVQGMADRYAYVPLIGFFIAGVWWLGDLTQRWPRAIPALMGVVTVGVLGFCTWTQAGYWRSNDTLFRHALSCTQRNYAAHTGLGFALLQRGRANEATDQFRRALAISPRYPNANVNMGAVLASQGRLDKAESYFGKALDSDPGEAHALVGLGRALLIRGELDRARKRFTEALRTNPNSVEAHEGMGEVLSLQGIPNAAVEHYSKALAIDPAHPEAHFRLALELERLGEVPDALSHYRAALRAQPKRVDAANNLAWVLATCPDPNLRRPDEAIRVARIACRITRRREVDLLDTLAAAYASAGRFDDAITAGKEALAAAGMSGRTDSIKEIRARLSLYEARRPYIETRGQDIPIHGTGS